MARPKNLRKIDSLPPFNSYLPVGAGRDIEHVVMKLEEYESIRLCDHELLSQQEAAERMGVSRPTLTRVYSKARRKIAEALACGKGIIIKGGRIFFDNDWYRCNSCSAHFNNYRHIEKPNCSLCGSLKVVLANSQEL